MREKIIEPKIYLDVKVETKYSEWEIMNFNQYKDSMQHIRLNVFDQNHCLMKISAKMYRSLGLPS